MLERAARTMFVKTHLVYAKVNGTPTINDNVTKAIVYLVRDPRDVACSLAAHKGMAVDAIIDQMENEQCVLPNGVGEIISSWSRNVESWTSPSRPSVLISRYEASGPPSPRSPAPIPGRNSPRRLFRAGPAQSQGTV